MEVEHVFIGCLKLKEIRKKRFQSPLNLCWHKFVPCLSPLLSYISPSSLPLNNTSFDGSEHRKAPFPITKKL